MRWQIHVHQVNKMGTVGRIIYVNKPGGLSLAAAIRTAKAIASLVAPRPISPLMGRPSNFRYHRIYYFLEISHHNF